MADETTRADVTGPPPAGAATLECDREPIHLPGSIQPHGFLVAVDAKDFSIARVSENAGEFLGAKGRAKPGGHVDDLFGEDYGAILRNGLAGITADGPPRYLGVFPAGEACPLGLSVIAHRSGWLLILELEPVREKGHAAFENIYALTSSFIARLQEAPDVAGLNMMAAREVRRLTGFDRVLIYQFDEDWNGTVVAEDRNDVLPSYFGHSFPASDIPEQARQLYRLNRFRLIPDASYRPVRILPADGHESGGWLDLTYSALRSVSPVHVEYMRNMGTAASMSISIIREGRLWGLISCHHGQPRTVPFPIRAACDFMGQVLSLQLAAREHGAEQDRRIELKSIQSRLLAFMAAEEDYRAGLTGHPDVLLDFGKAGGAAVVADEAVSLLGRTPDEDQVRRLVRWMEECGAGEVFHTSTLPALFPEAEAYKDRASGVLAIALSKFHPNYLLWFRPEVTRTITWAGEAAKHEAIDRGIFRLHPRKSFDAWKEVVRNTSPPFRASEVEAAAELRNAILGIVLRKAEEMAELSGELSRSNKELESFSYSVSHDLRAPFRHIVGYSELLQDRAGAKLDDEERRYLNAIGESAQQAGTLVDSLLAFSRMGRAKLDLRRVDMAQLVEEVRRGLGREALGREVEWKVGPLPEVMCDVMMMRSAIQNLLSNAVKFTRGRAPAVIEVSAAADFDHREHVFSVKDNGVGFDMAYADKLFGVFQRMHRMEDFEGTGIGLANVRRIAARHGGRTWADAEVNRGATLHFTLPMAD